MNLWSLNHRCPKGYGAATASTLMVHSYGRARQDGNTATAGQHAHRQTAKHMRKPRNSQVAKGAGRTPTHARHALRAKKTAAHAATRKERRISHTPHSIPSSTFHSVSGFLPPSAASRGKGCALPGRQEKRAAGRGGGGAAGRPASVRISPPVWLLPVPGMNWYPRALSKALQSVELVVLWPGVSAA
jgi:hypothetical protein